MDIYHSWLYVHLVNTRWFMWGIVLFIVAANFVGPVVAWYVISGKQLWQKKLLSTGNKNKNKNPNH